MQLHELLQKLGPDWGYLNGKIVIDKTRYTIPEHIEICDWDLAGSLDRQTEKTQMSLQVFL